MKLNMDSLIAFEELIRENTFDNKKFKKFTSTKGFRGFLEHECLINNMETNAKSVNEEIKNMMKFQNYKDRYGFYKVRDNLFQLRDDIKYIETNKRNILDKAIDKTYKIVPSDMSLNINIYLYIGGNDGGFTLGRKKIYINYAKYIGNINEFIKIISHELYHSRNISFKNRFIFFIETLFTANVLAHKTISKIIEEGIACLVQHGPYLISDDPTGTLTKRSLLLLKNEFEILNQIILKEYKGIKEPKNIEKLNIYTIGYHIITTIYDKEGVLILDDWTKNLKHRRIIQKYIEICNNDDIVSGFDCEVEKILINKEDFYAR
ncbi:hypothetical protein EDD65_10442 [Keratinibaculum paraultunense]|uniref:Uncharacterized protein n=1 Tax=Keratinibaculum paraultunense TaxID=1278232 RepID=A0A4R3KYJ5_9FIRM|nr:DUF5700 domain-containing putative Zn-dependent protease [Keratinibaculum paraultunense]QQY78889.1 hypothetical protein JL105_06720 [Keratinibaculum paraultunense]TCS90501.1 hypothetical protein EDD65_10442 [Keratinibaculum paraultunense]